MSDLTTKQRVYGFQIGQRVFDIQASSEKNAALILTENFWSFIDDYGSIELLGEIDKEPPQDPELLETE